MEGKRISHEVGKGSLTHNNRVFSAKNIDPTRTPQNVVLVRIPLEEAYRTLFDGAIERYNKKQSRKCRRIQTDYYTHLFNHKICEYTIIGNNKQKNFYEDLVQVGTMHDTGCGTPDAEIAKHCLQEYMEHYLKNNPNFFVFNAVIHMDEATPHLHIDYIPIGHYKTGIDTRNAMAQALAEMGYTGKDAAIKWRAHERQVFTEICESHGFVIAPPEESRGHSFTCEEYREIQEEKKRLNEELTPLREMELVAEETVVIGKKQLLSHNITVSPEEFEQLETQKKAVAVQSIENKRERKSIEYRMQALEKREAEIVVKEEESLSRLADRSSELDKREEKIRSSEQRVSDAANAVEIEKMKLQELEDKAEKKLKAAENEYNEQLELNKRYSELEREIRKVKRERDTKISEILNIRQTLGIPYSDDKTDAEEKIRELQNENHAIDRLVSDELRLPWSQMKDKTPIEMVQIFIDRSKNRIAEADREISESRSIIDKLTKQLPFIKQSFIKAVLALNALVYSDQYNRGLTGISKALATGISLFTDNIFRKLGEFDSIDKSAIDNEIRENMSHFIEPERTNNYYER